MLYDVRGLIYTRKGSNFLLLNTQFTDSSLFQGFYKLLHMRIMMTA